MSWVKISGAFGAALAGGLVLQAPVAKVAPHLLPKDGGVQVYELDGGIASGRAGFVSTNSAKLGGLHWDLLPLRLLALQLGADIRIEEGAQITGRISKSLVSDKIGLNNLNANAPLDFVQSAFGIAYLPISGQLQINLDSATFKAGLPTAMNGSAQLTDTQWKLGKSAALGDFLAQVTTEDGVISAAAQNAPTAQLQLDGTASIDADLSYKVDAKLKPTADTPAPVVNTMKGLGRTDQQGWYNVQQSGSLVRPIAAEQGRQEPPQTEFY